MKYLFFKSATMDPSELEGLAEEDKIKMTQMVEQMQMRDRCGVHCFAHSMDPRHIVCATLSWIGSVRHRL